MPIARLSLVISTRLSENDRLFIKTRFYLDGRLDAFPPSTQDQREERMVQVTLRQRYKSRKVDLGRD